jgi:phosphoglycolate phosphatase
VFDLDGTLVDSRRDLAESMNLLLEAAGVRPLPESAIGAMVGEGAATLVRRAFAAAGEAPPDHALERFLEIYDARLLRHTRPYEGVARVLEALGAFASLGVLTNKPLAATRQILGGLDLAKHFEGRVVGGDGPFPRKPDPQGLEYLMAEARQTPADTLMVGDSVIDWKVARGARTRVCIARYGFGFETFSAGVLQSDDLTIDAPADLLAL